MGKSRIIKKYDQLSEELLELIKQKYPEGYEDSLITFQTPKGEIEIGLPLETEEIYYLIKMPKTVVQDDDDDFDNSDSGGGTDDFENFDNLQIADDMSDDDE